ncbi:hypothetical protein ATL39_0695 [Sinobaca qinghaiensis]|uniref:Uncharacterized protein n=1 Tax=Sinobaca qinghaiensis TaxID=342944 RepID=A0A419V8N9_9BACL|nr:hypothetical protein [Sinobaca qinghaiensis]RKD76476.1 hypothetical protein ATL39_0695 [Sinobaca qinghaiensis]
MFGLDKNKNADGVINCSFPFVKPKAKKEMDGQVRVNYVPVEVRAGRDYTIDQESDLEVYFLEDDDQKSIESMIEVLSTCVYNSLIKQMYMEGEIPSQDRIKFFEKHTDNSIDTKKVVNEIKMSWNESEQCYGPKGEVEKTVREDMV